ncbi:hypothetical protein K431DRAFT_286995 [Polychaeton citri CBS 116435]|uniref:Phosphatidic acid phosphatase type 2/haloperoxidase domain-containing protein n=1 Tax=Polychaeton citri CBS 116435 TaxID=1314669 RepID=A0A9P4UMT1_9PEZI|nr:hypothetical protein K431DRAFT_286995 [Polychaeton citri CBS 116435]
MAESLSRTPSPSKFPDAGMRTVDHYQRRLPGWRYRLRQELIPIVRKETPILAKIQETCRTSFLDSYFAVTANLGTHTFFMTALPICFWCGLPDVGVAMVHMLALGVFLSGVVKDALCLPRPLSPPLKRISMSGSAALEYGFPSTHTTNAISVALFCLYELHQRQGDISSRSFTMIQLGLYWYAVSIMFGRLYCGMHGFFDIVIGIFLGGFITWLRIAFGEAFDAWILSGGVQQPFIAIVVCALAVRFHPEPADNCPCFDDSVAFSGVIMGLELGIWHFVRVASRAAHGDDAQFHTLYEFDNHDLVKIGARLVLGVVLIFAWRACMKPVLLWVLPPIYRSVDSLGFRLPRRYFKQSRDYRQVPSLRDDDKVLPPASDIPGMLSNMRHPRRRTVSVGPQSEADAREYIASREERRRFSRSESRQRALDSKASTQSLRSGNNTSYTSGNDTAVETPAAETAAEADSYLTAKPFSSYDPAGRLQVIGQPQHTFLLTPPPSDVASDSANEDEKQDREMFSLLEKPRVRYDVEVITKLVVYAGIAWMAVEAGPVIFIHLGLV